MHVNELRVRWAQKVLSARAAKILYFSLVYLFWEDLQIGEEKEDEEGGGKEKPFEGGGGAG